GGTAATTSAEELSSRIRAKNDVIATWALSKLADRSGNFIAYSYENIASADGDGDYTAQWMPSRIRYTGHQSDGGTTDLMPMRCVEFAYRTPRTWETDAYAHGLHVFKPRLLSEVSVNGRTGLVWKYAFHYQPALIAPPDVAPETATGRNRLDTVTRIAADGTE